MPYKTKRYSSNRSHSGYAKSARPHYGGRANNNKRRGPKKDNIDPALFIKSANLSNKEEYTAKHTFEDFDVHNSIKQNIKSKGYIVPSPIQDKTIPHVLSGRDVIGVANTGTGKTAAFAVPLINSALVAKKRSLVVAPTRELAQQINNEFRSIAKGTYLKTAVLIGGTGMGMQLRDLKQQPQIVVGTPGRIKDHIERSSLKLSNFSIVVLDEVDRMLDMGFVNDMTTILSKLPLERQSLFFSATLDNRVNALIETFASDPITVSIKTSDTSENVHQDVIYIDRDSQKIDKLHDLLIADNVKAIVFDDTQRSVERLSKELIDRGFKANAIHGGKTQGQRQRSLSNFKQNEVNVLVATDVAARGIDVADITHVINYSTPNSYSDYIHRIGRAGRASNIGYALTFVVKA